MLRKSVPFLELAARWYVFFTLTAYGLGKLLGGQFYREGHLPPGLARKTIAEVSSFELAWTFMGHSTVYIAFVGLSQVVGAFLLLLERTKLFGIAILIPVLLNIIVFDLVFDVPVGALASASFYFALLLFVLFANREKLQRIIREMWHRLPPLENVTWTERLKFVGIVVLLIVVLRSIDQFMINHIGQ